MRMLLLKLGELVIDCLRNHQMVFNPARCSCRRLDLIETAIVLDHFESFAIDDLRDIRRDRRDTVAEVSWGDHINSFGLGMFAEAAASGKEHEGKQWRPRQHAPGRSAREPLPDGNTLGRKDHCSG